MKSKSEKDIYKLIADILKTDESTIKNSKKLSQIEDWDSLNHLNILIKLDKFSLVFRESFFVKSQSLLWSFLNCFIHVVIGRSKESLGVSSEIINLIFIFEDKLLILLIKLIIFIFFSLLLLRVRILC